MSEHSQSRSNMIIQNKLLANQARQSGIEPLESKTVNVSETDSKRVIQSHKRPNRVIQGHAESYNVQLSLTESNIVIERNKGSSLTQSYTL